MANSKDRGVADDTTRVAADGAHKGNDRAADTARKVAGAAQEPLQHVVDEWTRGVKEGLTRYQEMFSQLPGFGMNGAEAGETRSVAREQLIEFSTDLLSYAQGSLNDSFEASKAVINAANMQEAMQVQIAHARKAMQDAGEQAMKLADRYAKASRAVARPMSGGTHAAPRGLSLIVDQARRVAFGRPEPFSAPSRPPPRLMAGKARRLDRLQRQEPTELSEPERSRPLPWLSVRNHDRGRGRRPADRRFASGQEAASATTLD